jgi:hypothetical protein
MLAVMGAIEKEMDAPRALVLTIFEIRLHFK